MEKSELQKWLENKLWEYSSNKEECLESMLSNTNNVIEQFLNSPNSLAAKGVLESCMKCNKEFLNKIEK